MKEYAKFPQELYQAGYVFVCVCACVCVQIPPQVVALS